MQKIRFVLMGVLLMNLTTLCQAKNSCAWLNEATASGLLGGDVVGNFAEATQDNPAVCTFVRQGAGFTRTLRITVEVTADATARLAEVAKVCGAGATPLKAIGNQALVCPADERKGTMGERVVGQVRNQIFTITMTGTLKGDPLLTRGELKARIYTAAEQVSGNLF